MSLFSCREEFSPASYTLSLILTIDSVSINTYSPGLSNTERTQMLPLRTDSLKITFKCQSNCDTVHSPFFKLGLAEGGDTFFAYSQNAVTFMADNDYVLYAGTRNFFNESVFIIMSFFNTSGFRYLRLKNIMVYSISS